MRFDLGPCLTDGNARREARQHAKRAPFAVEKRGVARCAQLAVHRCWCPHLERKAGHRAMKSLWGHPDDRVRKMSDAQCRADHMRIAVEVTLPVRVTDDQHRMRIL